MYPDSKAQAIAAEGQRRLLLLGPTIALNQALPHELAQIRQQARRVDVSIKRFLQWHQTYREQGKPGSSPTTGSRWTRHCLC